MNLDNKYARLQIYNKSDEQDENDLAEFLDDLPIESVKNLINS